MIFDTNALLEVMRQGECLLERIDDEPYRRILQPLFDSSLGVHIRHNLDHCACLLAGLESGLVDYAARSRDPGIEQDRALALAESRRLRAALKGMVKVPDRLCLATDRAHDRLVVETSVERELEFLMSHTLHHYSLVAVICRLQGIDVPLDFGVAPSTLRYRATLSAQTTDDRATDDRAEPWPRGSLPACAP